MESHSAKYIERVEYEARLRVLFEEESCFSSIFAACFPIGDNTPGEPAVFDLIAYAIRSFSTHHQPKLFNAARSIQ